MNHNQQDLIYFFYIFILLDYTLNLRTSQWFAKFMSASFKFYHSQMSLKYKHINKIIQSLIDT